MKVDNGIITKDILEQLKDQGKVAKISIEDKYAKRQRFDALGVREMKATHILAGLTKPEAFVFTKLEPRRDYITNTLDFSTSTLTPTEVVNFSKGFKGLVSKQVLERVSRGRPSIYMFNPDFIIPKDYEDAKALWDKIK